MMLHRQSTPRKQRTTHKQRVLLRRCCSIVVVYAHDILRTPILLSPRCLSLCWHIYTTHCSSTTPWHNRNNTSGSYLRSTNGISTRTTFLDAHPYTLPTHSRTDNKKQQPPQDHVRTYARYLCLPAILHERSHNFCSGQHFIQLADCTSTADRSRQDTGRSVDTYCDFR